MGIWLPHIAIVFSILLPISTKAETAAVLSVRPPITADTCADKDFSEKFGPIRNQGRVGQCFAFAAADLIGFHQGLTPNKQVSVIDVSSNFLTFDPARLRQIPSAENDFARQWEAGIQVEQIKKFRQLMHGKSIYDRVQMGGFGNIAIMAYNQRSGLCTEDNLASEATLVANDSVHFFWRRIQELGGFPSSGGFAISRPKPTIRCPIDPKTDWRSFNEVALRTMEGATQKACGTRLPMKQMRTDTIQIPKDPSFPTETVLASMIKKNIPVMLTIDSNFFAQGGDASLKPADHAVILVGTKWDRTTNQCHFKIRNSWGPSCSGYHESLRDRCEGGNLWLTGDELAKRVDSATAIDPSP